MSDKSPKINIKNKLKLLQILLNLVGAFVVAKIIWVQGTMGGEAREQADRMLIVPQKVFPYRGDILADNGAVLATSVPSYDVYIDPCAAADTLFTQQAGLLANALAVFPGSRSAEAYKEALKQGRKNRNRYMLLARHINYLQLKRMKSYPMLSLPRNTGGLIVSTDDTREHPFGSLAYRTVGYYNKDTAQNFPGLEGAYNAWLTGKTGLTMVHQVSRRIAIPIESENNIEPENGGDVVSTISIDIQDAADAALRRGLELHNADHGTVIIMEVETGAVKAICNLGRNENGTYTERYNYALGEAVDPGSTFKLMSYMRAIEDGYVEPEDTIDNGNGTVYFYGKRVWDDGRAATRGKLTIEQAFAQSSNVSVTKVIDKYYRGRESKYIEGLYAFHLNDSLGLDIAGEAHPYIKHPKSKTSNWSGLSLTQIAYGYEMQIAPIHTLTFYNAVANNGKMVKPLFVKELRKEGQTEKTFEPVVIDSKICSSSTISKVRHMMESVVEYGTAKGIKSDAYRIAGKTGTAQISNEKYGYSDKRHYASFVGYFPAEHPVYSGIVTVFDPRTNGTGGGAVAAPIFKEIADKIYNRSIRIEPGTAESGQQLPTVHPGRTENLKKLLKEVHAGYSELEGAWSAGRREENEVTLTERQIVDKLVPDVSRMGLKDALYILEQQGLHVQVEGSGYVQSQSLRVGSRITPEQTIVLRCSI